MEGLVNYSSEEEESGYNKTADGPMKRAGGDRNRYQGRSGNANSGYRNQAHDRYSSSQRSTSSHQRDGPRRDERHGSGHARDHRDSRDVRGRDFRDFDSGNQRHHENRFDHDRNRYERNEYNKREQERPRNNDRYNNRHATSSTSNFHSHNNSRDKHAARFSGGNNNYDSSRSRHSQNERRVERRDERNDRYSSSNRFDRSRQQQSNNKYTTRNRRSRSRSRSRSHSKDRKSPSSSERSPPINNAKATYERDVSSERESNTHKSNQSIDQSVRHIAPLISLPSSKANTVAASNNGGLVSNLKNTETTTTVQLPSYYNPSVINPTKYAEQVQKRKLLWSAKKTEDTAAKWGNAQFSQDTDGKVASKFMRLMGIKNSATSGSETEEKPTKIAPDVKSREAMFSSMEQQYEVARQVTHTMRGVGLGFGSSRPF